MEESSEETDRLFLRRAIRVMCHEITHMFGVKHCVYHNCLILGSNCLEESDTHPLFLCPICLRKIWAASKFDPLERYVGLREFFDGLGFAEDVAWLDRRIHWVETGEYDPEAGAVGEV